jgi:hypothetical protein
LKEIGHIDIPHGGRAIVKRSRATADQRFAVAAPTIKQAVTRALDAAAAGEGGSIDAPIPVAEIVALMEYLCAVILQVEGVKGCVWADMSQDERVDFLDEMGSSALMQMYVRYLWLRVTVDQPEVVAQIQAITEAARVDSSEEE